MISNKSVRLMLAALVVSGLAACAKHSGSSGDNQAPAELTTTATTGTGSDSAAAPASFDLQTTAMGTAQVTGASDSAGHALDAAGIAAAVAGHDRLASGWSVLSQTNRAAIAEGGGSAMITLMHDTTVLAVVRGDVASGAFATVSSTGDLPVSNIAWDSANNSGQAQSLSPRRVIFRLQDCGEKIATKTQGTPKEAPKTQEVVKSAPAPKAQEQKQQTAAKQEAPKTQEVVKSAPAPKAQEQKQQTVAKQEAPKTQEVVKSAPAPKAQEQKQETPKVSCPSLNVTVVISPEAPKAQDQQIVKGKETTPAPKTQEVVKGKDTPAAPKAQEQKQQPAPSPAPKAQEVVKGAPAPKAQEQKQQTAPAPKTESKTPATKQG